MIVLLTMLHVLVAIFLILVVLLQTGKGAEIGAAFGGASNTLFGSSGPANFLAKATTAAAVIFMLTSLSLAYIGMKRAPAQMPMGGSLPISRTAPVTPSFPLPGEPAVPAPAAPVAPAPVPPGGAN
jgi:preprotein translocase subunit SecG